MVVLVIYVQSREDLVYSDQNLVQRWKPTESLNFGAPFIMSYSQNVVPTSEFGGKRSSNSQWSKLPAEYPEPEDWDKTGALFGNLCSGADWTIAELQTILRETLNISISCVIFTSVHRSSADSWQRAAIQAKN